VVTPELVARMRAVGAIPIPFAGYVNFHGDVMHFYGDERMKRMFAYRSFIDAGLRAPTASDYTASPPSPMLWLYSMTTRRDPTGHVWGENQRITLAEALRAATLNGAYASFERQGQHRARKARGPRGPHGGSLQLAGGTVAGYQGAEDHAGRALGLRVLRRSSSGRDESGIATVSGEKPAGTSTG
jgi:Amidohydrolase family